MVLDVLPWGIYKGRTLKCEPLPVPACRLVVRSNSPALIPLASVRVKNQLNPRGVPGILPA